MTNSFNDWEDCMWETFSDWFNSNVIEEWQVEESILSMSIKSMYWASSLLSKNSVTETLNDFADVDSWICDNLTFDFSKKRSFSEFSSEVVFEEIFSTDCNNLSAKALMF